MSVVVRELLGNPYPENYRSHHAVYQVSDAVVVEPIIDISHQSIAVNMSGKNETRIASLMGTWTSTLKFKASIGNYQLLTYFVVHLMPDPMREYSCSRKNCRELDSQVCIKQDEGNHAGSKCINMTDQVVEWSDGTCSRNML